MEIQYNWPAWMRRPDASRYLREVHGIKLAAQTLAKLAITGDGPEFEMRGRFIVHNSKQLDRYAAKRSLGTARSTTEAKALKAAAASATV